VHNVDKIKIEDCNPLQTTNHKLHA